ncbi:MAG: DUF805 domain-containing protein [Chloroflexota bacterium]
MNWYIGVLKKYAVFSGRARRKEYWMFVLFNIVAAVILSLVESLVRGGSGSASNTLVSIYQLAVLLPTIGVAVRRMHDTDHSGWWLLVPIANLIFALTAGTQGDNRFGPDPKAGEQ